MVFTHNAFGAIAAAFSVTTTNLSAGTAFTFKISASGTFSVDCGTDGTLSGFGVSSGTIINRSNTTTNDTYTCTYSSGGVKTISFYNSNNHVATGYSTNTDVAAISFSGNTRVSELSGELSAVFPQVGNLPSFYQTFSGCTNLTKIPSSLFVGITTGKESMFSRTFSGCTSLTLLPNGLFSNIVNTANANNLFEYTFYGCTGLTSIPGDLFNGITIVSPNANTSGVFYGTFYGCTGLTNIPGNLFNNITDATNTYYLFGSTFQGCTGLTNIPGNLFEHITAGSSNMFANTFYGCTGLTTIPSQLFSHITSGADGMFLYTFYGCSGLTSIPSNLFQGITNGFDSMFYNTFAQCTGLTYLPDNLFANIASTANSMFFETFAKCTGLGTNLDVGKNFIPPTLFAGLINVGSPTAPNMMKNTFYNTNLLTQCPADYYQYITMYEGQDWSNKISCVPCPSGSHSPAGSTTINQCVCPEGYEFNSNHTACDIITYNITYVLGNGGVSGTDAPTTVSYNQVFHVSNPTGPGYTFTGWQISDMDTTEHWYGHSNNLSQHLSNTTLNLNNATDIQWFKNLRASSGTVTFIANWRQTSTQLYTVTYNCGYYNGTAPASQPVLDGVPFTPAADAPDCGQMNDATLTGWAVSGTNDIKTPGTAFSYEYDEDKTFTAIWSCYPNSDETDCVAGYKITLPCINAGADVINRCFGPRYLYTISTVGAFLDPSRTQLMTSNTNNVVPPSRQPVVFNFDTNAPDDPALTPTVQYTTNPATVAPIAKQYWYVAYKDGVDLINQYGYISDAGTNRAASITADEEWGLKTATGSSYTPSLSLTGYIFGGWYDNINGTGTQWTHVYVSSNAPSLLYAKWTPKTYDVVYNPGVHATSGSTSYTDTNGAEFDSPYTPLSFDLTPISNNMSADTGYVFVGWTTDSTPTFTNGGLDNEYTGDTYWKRDSDLTLYAAYDCDTENGYDWNNNNTECVLVPVIKTVNLKWFINNQEYNLNQNSCEYGVGQINNITHEEIPGWTFTGWLVTNHDECGLLEVSTNVEGQDRYAIGWANNANAYSDKRHTIGANIGSDPAFNDLNTYEWKVIFNYGTIYGTSKCSAKSGNNSNYQWPSPSSDWVATESELTSAGNGASCWCGVTKYSPVSGPQCIKTSINWGFHSTDTSYSQCSKDCSYWCANDIEGKAKFRAALYGITK